MFVLLLLSAFSRSEKIEEKQGEDEEEELLPERGTCPVRCPSCVHLSLTLFGFWSFSGAWMFHSAPPASRLQSSHLATIFRNLFLLDSGPWIVTFRSCSRNQPPSCCSCPLLPQPTRTSIKSK